MLQKSVIPVVSTLMVLFLTLLIKKGHKCCFSSQCFFTDENDLKGNHKLESLSWSPACMSFFFQFESVQPLLQSLEGQRALLRPQLASLEQEVGRLKEWASGLTDKRTQLQSSLTELGGAVGQIEGRTSAITKDLTNKVHHFCYSSFFVEGNWSYHYEVFLN